MAEKPIDILEGLSPREGSARRALENLRLAARTSPVLVEWVDAVEKALLSDPQRLIYALETALERSERGRQRLEGAFAEAVEVLAYAAKWFPTHPNYLSEAAEKARAELAAVQDLVNPGGGQ